MAPTLHSMHAVFLYLRLEYVRVSVSIRILEHFVDVRVRPRVRCHCFVGRHIISVRKTDQSPGSHGGPKSQSC